MIVLKWLALFFVSLPFVSFVSCSAADVYLATQPGHPAICLTYPWRIVDREDRFNRLVEAVDGGQFDYEGTMVNLAHMTKYFVPNKDRQLFWSRGKLSAHRAKAEQVLYAGSVSKHLPRLELEGGYNDSRKIADYPRLNIGDRLFRRGAVVSELITPAVTTVEIEGGRRVTRKVRVKLRNWQDHCGDLIDMPTIG